MSSLKARVEALEADLKASPMRHYIYSDLPFAIFAYPPAQEWDMRREIGLLKTRLEKDTGRRVETISLADLLWQSVDESEGMAEIVDLERQQGFAAAEEQVGQYLSHPAWRPLPQLLIERLAPLDPQRTIAFLVRADALAPHLYKVSTLLDQIKGQARVPSVLFMPAETEGVAFIRFMGLPEMDAVGSYHTRVYVE